MADFGWALNTLKAGARVSRGGWNGKGMYLELQQPDEHSKMTLPYIFMYTAQGDRVPWLASQTDMLGDDWALFIERPADGKPMPLSTILGPGYEDFEIRFDSPPGHLNPQIWRIRP